jgi:hypothetical protein
MVTGMRGRVAMPLERFARRMKNENRVVVWLTNPFHFVPQHASG